MLRDIEDDSIGILELSLEISFPLVAEIEEERSARRLDTPLCLGQIINLKSEMIGPGMAGRICRSFPVLPAKLRRARLTTPSLI